MANTLLKRTLAGLALAGTMLVAAPAIASADIIVYEGKAKGGGYIYTNQTTGGSFVAMEYLGARIDTECAQ